MLNLRTEVGVLHEIFSPVDALADSCEIQFSNQGLKIPAGDRMNIAIADIEVLPSAFESYEAENTRLGLQMQKLTKALGMADNADIAQLYLDEDDFLHIKVSNKEFVLGLVSLDSVPKQPGLPKVNYPAHFSIDKATLQDAIRTAGVFSDKVTIEVDGENQIVMFQAEGDIDRTTVSLTGSELNKKQLADAENSFSQDYLNNLITTIPDDTEVSIKMDQNRPLKLSHPIADGKGSIEFTIASWKEGT